jgi:hypothetical protein
MHAQDISGKRRDLEQKLSIIERRMRQRRRSDIELDDSEDHPSSPHQNRKRRKLGGIQLGSVLVGNVNGLESDSETSENSPKSSARISGTKTASEEFDHGDGAATRDGAKRVVPDPARNESGRRKRSSAEHAPGSASVHFRGVSYNATTAEVQEYLARCGECPVRAVRWPNERSRNCGLVPTQTRSSFISNIPRLIRSYSPGISCLL